MLQVIDKNSQNAVNSAAKELRRNYSKKVADKLAFLTKTSLKILSKHFASASTDVKVEVCFHSHSYFQHRKGKRTFTIIFPQINSKTNILRKNFLIFTFSPTLFLMNYRGIKGMF